MEDGLMFTEAKTRRRKAILLSPETVLSVVLGMGKRLPDCLYIPHLDGVPTDAKILGVRWSFESRTFAVMLEHESFEEVPEGMYTPSLPLGFERVVMDEYARKEDTARPDAVVGR